MIHLLPMQISKQLNNNKTLKIKTMKKATTLFLILFALANAAKSQSLNALLLGNEQSPKNKASSAKFQSPTTEEEYNYMVNGYKTSIQNGTGIKQGYSVKKSESPVSIGRFYTFNFTPLLRSDGTFAGIIVNAHSTLDGIYDYWYGLPFKNEQLFDKFYTSFSSLDQNIAQAFLSAFVYYTRTNAEEATTQEEYNYMITGYGDGIKQGLDVRNGYKTEAAKNIRIVGSMANYDFAFIPFLRDNGSPAGTIVKLNSDGSWSGGTYYFGVANSRGEILNQFFTLKNKQGYKVSQAFLAAYIKYALNNL